MKRLDELLKNAGSFEIAGSVDISVTSLVFDSRKIEGDDSPLYVAQRGTHADGHLFVEQAIRNGAKAVVLEEWPEKMIPEITYIKVPDSTLVLGRMASSFYDDPSGQLQLIGITGTNGKTTIATLLYRLFMAFGFPAGLISTIENIVDGEVIPSTHTTPDAVTLNRLLRTMVDKGCQYCFMEVSSHAIDQQRIAGIEFTGAVFSNITHDHLDYHKTFAQYLKAKKAFFDRLPKKAFALVNKDDKNGLVMVQNSKAVIRTYSLSTAADFKGKILDNSFEGLHMMVDNEEVYFRLTGKFNAYNLLAIYGTAVLLGLPGEEVLIRMSGLESAAGRFQLLKNERGCKAIIDYAHTPDALQNVLSTIREIVDQNTEVITVVGAGGDRDALKRPVMASTACKLSQKVILTSDNPRSEDPYSILKDMESGIPASFKKNVLLIEDREEAIKTACMILKDHGVLLVAGKGHENYQEIKGIKHHFDDMEIVEKYF